jgi:Fe-S cluster assembly protein SufD
MSTLSDATRFYREKLAASVAELPGARLPWMRSRREEAMRQLEAQGFPTQKHERWRYTNVTPIFEHLFEPAAGPLEALQLDDVEHLLLDDSGALRLVFVNGFLDPRLSAISELPDGVTLGGLGRLLERAPDSVEPHLHDGGGSPWSAFAALNTAYSPDGAVLRLAPGVELETPVDILHVSLELEQPVAVQPRSLIVLDPGAAAQVSERFVSIGNSRYLTNARTQVRVGDDARLELRRVQRESPRAFHIGTLDVVLGTRSRFASHNLALGGRLGRTDINVTHQGEEAECRITGLFLSRDGQLADFHTNVEHAVPGGSTQQRFKGVLAGRGRGVFDGRVHVHPGAQHIEAHMSSDNLMLSRQAEVDTKPQLEIYADDVKCSHGATVGQLDAGALFYLRSRGIPEIEARRLLTRGFVVDLLDAMGEGSARRWMEAALNERLGVLDG